MIIYLVYEANNKGKKYNDSFLGIFESMNDVVEYWNRPQLHEWNCIHITQLDTTNPKYQKVIGTLKRCNH